VYKKKSFFEIYLYLIIAVILTLVIFYCYNFNAGIFSDRDLIRSQNLKNSFEIYGADFGMQNGRRIPGAFNYYYLFLLTSISKNILILNYISLILSLFTFAYLLVSHKKTISYVGLLFSIIFYLTSPTFITQLTKFWNPTLGLPFIIISLNFFLIFLNKPKFSYLFFAFIFVFLANQFHLSYSVFVFIYLVIAIFEKHFSLLKLFIIIVSCSFLVYAPLILNVFFSLVNIDTNDYFLINSILNNNPENSNVFFWVLEKLYFEFNLILKHIFHKKLIFISLICILILLLLNYKKLKKIFSLIKLQKYKKYFSLSLILIFILMLIIYNDKLNLVQFKYFFSILILGLFANIILLNKSNFLHWDFFNILFVIFFLIIIISSAMHSLTYNIISIIIGTGSRYNLAILPIYSIISGFSLSIIYSWATNKDNFLKNLIIFLITILITSKAIIFFYNQSTLSNKDLTNNYNFKISLIKVLGDKFNLTQNDFYTKVGVGFFNDNMNVENLKKQGFQFYINNNFSKKDSYYSKNCLLLIIDNYENSYHKFKKNKILNDLTNNIKLFGSKINILQYFEFKDFLIIEYKSLYGDCLKNTLNDYIITDKEKKILKFLLNKENNKFYSHKTEDLSNYYIKIKNEGMMYPMDLAFEFKKENNKLKIITNSKRLRNSDTYLNGYWDSTNLLNPKIIFKNTISDIYYEIPLVIGSLGEGFMKTPWTVSTSSLTNGNYKIWFEAEKLSESFNKINMENISFLIDDNFNF